MGLERNRVLLVLPELSQRHGVGQQQKATPLLAHKLSVACQTVNLAIGKETLKALK